MEYYPTIQLSFVCAYKSEPKFENITDVSDLRASGQLEWIIVSLASHIITHYLYEQNC